MGEAILYGLLYARKDPKGLPQGLMRPAKTQVFILSEVDGFLLWVRGSAREDIDKA